MPVLVDPTGQSATLARQRAPRTLRSLRGTRVCLIDNTKRNADLLLQALGELLRERYGVSEVLNWRKANESVPIDDTAVQELRSKCDFAIAAVGD